MFYLRNLEDRVAYYLFHSCVQSRTWFIELARFIGDFYLLSVFCFENTARETTPIWVAIYIVFTVGGKIHTRKYTALTSTLKRRISFWGGVEERHVCGCFVKLKSVFVIERSGRWTGTLRLFWSIWWSAFSQLAKVYCSPRFWMPPQSEEAMDEACSSGRWSADCWPYLHPCGWSWVVYRCVCLCLCVRRDVWSVCVCTSCRRIQQWSLWRQPTKRHPGSTWNRTFRRQPPQSIRPMRRGRHLERHKKHIYGQCGAFF